MPKPKEHNPHPRAVWARESLHVAAGTLRESADTMEGVAARIGDGDIGHDCTVSIKAVLRFARMLVEILAVLVKFVDGRTPEEPTPEA